MVVHPNVPFTDPSPPHATAAEQALLGALVMGESVATAASLVHWTDFFDKPYGQLYRVICDLGGNDGRVTREQVADELERHPIYGINLMRLMAYGTLPGLMELHARDIRSASFARALISLAARLTKDCYDRPKDAAALLERIKRDVAELEGYYHDGKPRSATTRAIWQ